MNLVALIGDCSGEPEIRYTSSGRAVTKFRIAVDGPGRDTPDFFTCVAWERQAEVIAEYLTIGRRVCVEGRLHQCVWESNSGGRSTVEIVVSRVRLLDKKTQTT